MTGVVPTEREQTARNLILLGMLADQVGKAQKRLRAELQQGARAGEKWSPSVPDPDAPEPEDFTREDPELAAGTARFDRGAVTVRVTDESAFLDWMEANYPTRVVKAPESDGRRAMTARELGVVMNALTLAEEARTGFDPLQAMAVAFWGALQDAGFSLAPRVGWPAARVLRPGWQDQLFEDLTKNAREEPPGDVTPVDAAGLVVDGVTVTAGPPKLVVSPSHDKDIQDAYVRQQLGSTFELLPAEPTKSEDR